MKTKILVKMLAIAIAASTVALTPGLASAVTPKFLGRKTKRSLYIDFDDPRDPRRHILRSGEFVFDESDDDESNGQETSFQGNGDQELSYSGLGGLEFGVQELQAPGFNNVELIFENNRSATDLVFNGRGFTGLNVNMLSRLKPASNHEANNAEDNVKIEASDAENFAEPENLRERKIAQFEELLNDDFLSGDKKKNFLGLMKYFAGQNFENEFFQGQIEKTISQLLIHSHNNDKRELVAKFVGDLAEKGGLGQIEALEKNKFWSIVKILEECANNDDAKVAVAGAMVELEEQGFLEKYFQKYVDMHTSSEQSDDESCCEYSSNEPYKVFDLLCKCAEGSVDAKCNVALVISVLSCGDALTKCSQPQILKLFGMLEDFSKIEDEDLREIVAASFMNISVESKVCQHVDYIMDIVLNLLNNCLKTKKTRQDVATATVNLLENKFLSNNSGKDIENVVNILKSCVDDKDSVQLVLRAILSLFEQDVFSKCSEQKEAIFDLIEKCFADESSRRDIAQTFEKFFDKNSLKGFPENDFSFILNLLKKCAESEDARESVAVVINKVVGRDFLKKYSKDVIFDMLDILDKCIYNEKSKELVVEAISRLVSDGFLGGCSKEQFFKIVYIFVSCNVKNLYIAQDIDCLISHLIENKELSRDEIFIIIYSLSLLSISDGADAADAAGFVILIADRLLFSDVLKGESFTLDEMSHILTLLENCSGFNSARERVITIIDKLYTDGFVKKCFGSVKPRMVKILEKCAAEQNYSNRYSGGTKAELIAKSVLEKFKKV